MTVAESGETMAISEYMRGLRGLIGTRRIMTPAVSAVVVDDNLRVLLHRARHDGNWYVVGGAPDPGEDLADAAVREVLEETGIRVVPERLIGVYTDPLVRYDNGDEVLYVATAFRCRPVGGQARIADDESLEVRYFAVDQLPPLMDTHRLRIEHALSPAFGAAYCSNGDWKR